MPSENFLRELKSIFADTLEEDDDDDRSLYESSVLRKKLEKKRTIGACKKHVRVWTEMGVRCNITDPQLFIPLSHPGEPRPEDKVVYIRERPVS